MAKVEVKPKSRILYDALRDEGMKKKKAAKIANGFIVTERRDASSSLRPGNKKTRAHLAAHAVAARGKSISRKAKRIRSIPDR